MDNKNMNNNEIGAIGIGAMIVFIALILVAAVASAVIIQTGEKLQQNAQQSGSDTQREISGKISINNMLVFSDNNYMIYFESSAGSGVIDNAEVNYQLSCDNGGYQYYSADMSTATLSSGGGAVTSIEPGLQYRIDVSGTNCGAANLGVNEEATLWIHVNGGGSTYEKIYISNTAHGSQVI